ncbi:MAG: DUF3147 family protein [Sphingomonas taxi]
MAAFLARAAVSGILVALIALIARRSPALGALVASLPIVSVMGMIWLWHDTRDPVRLADHAQATLWYVVPSLPMFLLIPLLLRHGAGFWTALGVGCAATIGLYLATVAIAARFGVTL